MHVKFHSDVAEDRNYSLIKYAKFTSLHLRAYLYRYFYLPFLLHVQFRSFNEQISSLKIDVVHRVGNVSEQPEVRMCVCTVT